MEKYRTRSLITANLLAVSAFSACSIDSYLRDPSNVQCDGKRTMSDLSGNGNAIFIVHGKDKSDVATITVKRDDGEVSVKVTGEVTGPPQQLERDGFTTATPILDGAELGTFGGGGAWVIDAREDSIVIQGTCDGM
ncbi:hypothetical protein H7Y29_00390 [Microbacteriaceae bacterium]|nr:hypothetical protein [Candidatus Saccharibacteria bacterium]